MKFLITGIFMLAVSGVTHAQSTCVERCEKHVGVGDKDCPYMCEGVDDRIKRKKKDDGAAAAAFAAGAASAAASTSASIPKKEPVESKESKSTPDNTKPGK